jgi:exosortase D (VPLPA-CTERM-specific)
MTDRFQTKNAVHWLAVIAVFASFLLMYAPVLPDMIGRWNDPDFSHCFLVPWIAAYFAYTKRYKLRSLRLRSSAWGWLLILFSGMLFLAGKLGSVETLVYISFWLSIVGMVVTVLGGHGARVMAFPLFMLGFMVPLPSFLNSLFTFKLKLLASDLAAGILRFTGKSVHRAGNIIDLPNMQVQVVDACSGLHYIYTLLLLGFVVGYLGHVRWSERVLVAAAAIPLAVFANSMRIVGMAWLSPWISPEAMEGLFHNFFGIFVFVFTILMLFLFSSLIRLSGEKYLTKKPIDGNRVEKDGVSGSLLVHPIHVGVSVLLMILIWSVSINFNMTLISPSRLSFSEFSGRMGEWEKYERSFIDSKVNESLWSDDHVQITYRHRDTGHVLLLFIAYYAYQGVKHTAHSPLACLMGSGWAPRSRRTLAREFPSPLGQVQISQMVFEAGNQWLLSNFWFQGRGRVISNEYWHKWYLFWDAIRLRRNDGALVRIEMPLARGQDIETAQKLLDDFIQDLETVLPRYVPG